MRFTLILETFIVPRGMKLSALISNSDHESIFKIPWLQSMHLYSSLRVHLCQEMENYVDVPQGIACKLTLAEGQCSLREPEQCPGHTRCPSACKCAGTEPCGGWCWGVTKAALHVHDIHITWENGSFSCYLSQGMTSSTESSSKTPIGCLGNWNWEWALYFSLIFYLWAKRSFQNVFCLVFFYIIWIMRNSCLYSYLKMF